MDQKQPHRSELDMLVGKLLKEVSNISLQSLEPIMNIVPGTHLFPQQKGNMKLQLLEVAFFGNCLLISQRKSSISDISTFF